jgi:hypothetical protein
MDLSKLPKFSHTPAPPPPANPSAGVPRWKYIYQKIPAGQPGDAWLAIAIGVIILLLQRNLLLWFGSFFGRPGPVPYTELATGKVLQYVETIYFFHDLGLGLFALSMILEGFILLQHRRVWLICISMGFTGFAALWNAATVVRFFATLGLQWMPALAFVFGVYSIMTLVGIIRENRARYIIEIDSGDTTESGRDSVRDSAPARPAEPRKHN